MLEKIHVRILPVGVKVRSDIKLIITFPIKSLHTKFFYDERFLSYKWVLFNEDYNKISYGQKRVDISSYMPIKKRDKKKQFKDSISLQLREGVYTVAVRIEDKKTRRLGIQKKVFVVE